MLMCLDFACHCRGHNNISDMSTHAPTRLQHTDSNSYAATVIVMANAEHRVAEKADILFYNN